MRIVVFDTETTGLPKSRKPVKSMKDNWPHIVSISWCVLENDSVVETHSYIVRPIHWTIPDDSIAIHGITNEKAMREGVDLEFVMNKFIATRYDVLIAHNIDFDENVLMNAIYWDLGRVQFLEFPHPKRCTMNLSRNICKLSFNGHSYKSPRLSELYKFVFGREPDTSQLHGSLYDVQILVEIIQNCQPLREKLGLIKPHIIPFNAASSNSNILCI